MCAALTRKCGPRQGARAVGLGPGPKVRAKAGARARARARAAKVKAPCTHTCGLDAQVLVAGAVDERTDGGLHLRGGRAKLGQWRTQRDTASSWCQARHRIVRHTPLRAHGRVVDSEPTMEARGAAAPRALLI